MKLNSLIDVRKISLGWKHVKANNSMTKYRNYGKYDKGYRFIYRNRNTFNNHYSHSKIQIGSEKLVPIYTYP